MQTSNSTTTKRKYEDETWMCLVIRWTANYKHGFFTQSMATIVYNAQVQTGWEALNDNVVSQLDNYEAGNYRLLQRIMEYAKEISKTHPSKEELSILDYANDIRHDWRVDYRLTLLTGFKKSKSSIDGREN
jgi:hypothetical protein